MKYASSLTIKRIIGAVNTYNVYLLARGNISMEKMTRV